MGIAAPVRRAPPRAPEARHLDVALPHLGARLLWRRRRRSVRGGAGLARSLRAVGPLEPPFFAEDVKKLPEQRAECGHHAENGKLPGERGQKRRLR